LYCGGHFLQKWKIKKEKKGRKIKKDLKAKLLVTHEGGTKKKMEEK